MVKVSDYIMDFLVSLGIEDVFYVSGGGAMHMNDSLGRNEKLRPVAMLHEQGASIAAEAYARIHKDGVARSGDGTCDRAEACSYGACLVTSGPGGTNAVTGVAGAWQDATPVIFLSGQVKRADLVGGQNVRQFGIQEVDIVSIVQSVTKYAVQIKQPEDIRYELEKAAYLAREGKPGPVWIDVPLDVQASMVEEGELRGFDRTEEVGLPESGEPYRCTEEQISQVIRLFNSAKRPLILLGHGVRLAGAAEVARELYNYLCVPVMTSWNGVDLIEALHPFFFGRPGAVGRRSANLILQKADFVLTLGTRLNLLATGYNYESFLKNAVHAMVEIDANEMNKKNIHPQLRFHCDVGDFLRRLWDRRAELKSPESQEVSEAQVQWVGYCMQMHKKYPRFIPEQTPGEGYVNTYHLVDEVARQMTETDIYQFTSSGTAVDIAMQTFRVKWGQRAFLTKGLAAMGFDLPACVGTAVAAGGHRRVVCITGDGSILMNVQELEVLKRLNLPVKIFVVDNRGYGMIYGSQNGNFNGRLTGCTEESGLSLPDLNRVAEGFGLKTFRIEDEDRLAEQVREVLETPGPVVCTVHADIAQKVLPRQANYMREDGQMASRPLDDMLPLLSREEMEENQI